MPNRVTPPPPPPPPPGGWSRPHARQGAAEEVVVLGEQPPDLAAIDLDGGAIGGGNAQILEADAPG